jgi:hypothetical protein
MSFTVLDRNSKVLGTTLPQVLKISNDDANGESEDEEEETQDLRDNQPSSGDLSMFRISHLMRDLSLEPRNTTGHNSTPMVQTLDYALQDLETLVQSMEQGLRSEFQSEFELDFEPMIQDIPNTPPSELMQETQTPDSNQAFRDFKVIIVS